MTNPDTLKLFADFETQAANKPGGRIPTVPAFIAAHFAANPEKYQESQSHEQDTRRLMHLSTKGLSQEDAEELAWLLWNARGCWMFAKRNGSGFQNLSWEASVFQAWSDGPVHKALREARAAAKKARDAKRTRYEAMSLCDASEDSKARTFEGTTVDAHNEQKAATVEKAKEERKAKSK